MTVVCRATVPHLYSQLHSLAARDPVHNVAPFSSEVIDHQGERGMLAEKASARVLTRIRNVRCGVTGSMGYTIKRSRERQRTNFTTGGSLYACAWPQQLWRAIS